MADPLQRVTAGKRVQFSARSWNRMIDAADRVERQEKSGGGQIETVLNPAIATIRNRSGVDIATFGILAIGGQSPVFHPDTVQGLQEFQQEVIIEGVTPTAAGQALCVLLEPITFGLFGRAALAGAVPVQVNVSDVTHRYATTINGDTTKLASHASAGSIILSRPPTTGVQWLYVLLCCQDGWAPEWSDPGSGSGSGGGGEEVAQEITTTGSGTFTFPDDMIPGTASVDGWGGGGGGGGGAAGSGGGAGAGFSRKALPSYGPGGSVAYSIGAGGAGGIHTLPQDGAAGGDTLIGAVLLVKGGNGGAESGAGGTSGGLGIGDLRYAGGAGAAGATDIGGGGGSSAGPASNGNAGSGTIGGAAVTGGGAGGRGGTPAPILPVAGSAPGGGGGGGGQGYNGAAGANGKLIFRWLTP